MDFNTILMLVGLAVLILPVVYMLGYVQREKQHKAELFSTQAAVDAEWRERSTATFMKMHELELALRQLGEALELESNAFNGMKAQWVYADKYRKAIVNYMVVNHIWNFDVHSDDPMAMLAEIVKWETKMALDPVISKAAKNLHTRGVRKGAAMGRKQMAKLMQKSIDNQALTIQMLQIDLKSAQEDFDDAAMRRNMWREAVLNTLEDKIALPGVRKAIKVAITTEYDRMKAVQRLLKD